MDTVRITNDYLIFFDNVRFDHIVSGFSTNHSIDSAMPSATVSATITFGRELTKAEYDMEYNRYRQDMYKLKTALAEKTNVFIFIKNIVSDDYCCVFNGLLSDIFITTSKSRRTLSIDISCVGAISLLQELEALLSIPFEDLLNRKRSATAFKLQARTLKVDFDSVDYLQNAKLLDSENLQLTDIVANTRDALDHTNQVFMDPESTQSFNAIIDRIGVYSDIDPELLSNSILDYSIVTDALTVETLYVRLAKQLSRMMLEFYESPTGETVIKAPYWNAPILHNHIIPDIAIVSENYAERSSQRVTRMIVQGNVSYELIRDSSTFAQQFVIPMAAYTEDSDGNSRCADLSDTQPINFVDDNLWLNSAGVKIFEGDEIGSSFYDSLNLVGEDSEGTYLAYRSGSRSVVKYVGPQATVVSIGANPLISQITNFDGGDEDLVLLVIDSGPYEGCFILYGGVYDCKTSIGRTIKTDAILGYSYTWSKNVNQRYMNDGNKPNIFIRGLYPDYKYALSENKAVGRIYINPKIMLRDFYSSRNEPTTGGIALMDIGSFGTPTDLEKKFGVSTVEESQPIIRFSEVGGYYSIAGETPKSLALKTLRQYAAYRYKAINANVTTLALSLIPMPWLKPGFNVWVDPTGMNEVYYASTVSHRGGPDGVFTNVSLTMGRPADRFFEGATGSEPTFGAISNSGTYGSNVFITKEKEEFEKRFKHIGLVKSYSDESGYSAMMNNVLNFKSKGARSYNMAEEPFLKDLFTPNYTGVQTQDDTPLTVADLPFDLELSEARITELLDSLYENTKSTYAKARAITLSLFMSELDATWAKGEQ